MTEKSPHVPPVNIVYAWREYLPAGSQLGTCRSTPKPLLLDPYGFGKTFATAEQAQAWKVQYAPYYNWWLCRLTEEPLSLHGPEASHDRSLGASEAG